LPAEADDFGKQQTGQSQFAGRMISRQRHIGRQSDADGDHTRLAARESLFVEGDVGFRKRLIDDQDVDIVIRGAIAAHKLAAGGAQGFAPSALALGIASGQQYSHGTGHRSRYLTRLYL
jgi:hypothetical protein